MSDSLSVGELGIPSMDCGWGALGWALWLSLVASLPAAFFLPQTLRFMLKSLTRPHARDLEVGVTPWVPSCPSPSSYHLPILPFLLLVPISHPIFNSAKMCFAHSAHPTHDLQSLCPSSPYAIHLLSLCPSSHLPMPTIFLCPPSSYFLLPLLHSPPQPHQIWGLSFAHSAHLTSWRCTLWNRTHGSLSWPRG